MGIQGPLRNGRIAPPWVLLYNWILTEWSKDTFFKYPRIAYLIFDNTDGKFCLFWSKVCCCLTSVIDLGLVCKTSQLSRNFRSD